MRSLGVETHDCLKEYCHLQRAIDGHLLRVIEYKHTMTINDFYDYK